MKKILTTALIAGTLALGTAPAHAASGADIDSFSWGNVWSQIALLLPAVQKVREAAR